MIVLWLALGCGGAGDAAAPPATAVSIEAAECDVCGMDLRDQPAPRGQVVYRGGQRRFACSITDLRAMLQTPSPLGRPTAVFVEVSGDPHALHREAQPWIPAEQAWFVFGLQRPEVMGLPALVFADREQALPVAAELHTVPVPWTAVRDTPFDHRPEEPR